MNACPTQAQLMWHDREIGMFIHFGLYCYRKREDWFTPGDPNLFNPVDLDAIQWVSVAQSLGAQYIVFTAKHADGFCLWQTETSSYGVRSSSWKNGAGDVVREISEACRDAGIAFGVYLSPADGHFGAAVGGVMADDAGQAEYDRIYRAQLTELLTRYGEVCEVWFDGNCVVEVGDILAGHAPEAMVFQSKYATIRWVGNEAGFAPDPAWNAVRAEDGESGMATAAHGDASGDLWLPLEVDTTIRDHYWMWEPETEDTLKSLAKLMEVYYRSVGHGAVLLLNSNPDTTGLIPEPDAARAREFGAEIAKRFGSALAATSGTGNEVYLDLQGERPVDHVVMAEDITNGQAVTEYVIHGKTGERWSELSRGSAIGHKKIDFFHSTEVSRIKLHITNASGTPIVKTLAAYNCGTVPEFDPGKLDIHDPFVAGRWSCTEGEEWISFRVDLGPYCREARQYRLELTPDDDAHISVKDITLLQDGTKVDGYMTSGGRPNRWNLNITAYDSDYQLAVILRHVGGTGTGGKVIVR